MRLSDLLDSAVIDEEARDVGRVHDVRLVQDGHFIGSFGAAFRVEGLIVGRRSFGSRLGFDRRRVRAPWLLNVLFRRLHRDVVFVSWDLIRSLEPDVVRIRGRRSDLATPRAL